MQYTKGSFKSLKRQIGGLKMWVLFKDLSKEEQNKYSEFVKGTYLRNGSKKVPGIRRVKIGNASEPFDLIELDNYVKLYYNIHWADEENDKLFTRR